MKTYFAIFLALTSMYSCTTPKTIISRKEIKNISSLYLLDSVKANYGTFSTYQGKFKLSVKNGKKTNSLAGSIKIKKDSLMWISVNPGFGIEVARALLLQDSLMFLERINSTYYKGTYDNMNELFGLEADYSTLQSVFLNSLYFYNSSDNPKMLENLRIRKDKNGKFIDLENLTRRKVRKYENKADTPIVYQRITVDNSNLKVSEILVKDFKDNQSLFIQYSDYVYNDSIRAEFPQSIVIKIISKEHNIEADIKFTKQLFNVENEYSFSVPASYKPIPISAKNNE